jgi:hypothetical protein
LKMERGSRKSLRKLIKRSRVKRAKMRRSRGLTSINRCIKKSLILMKGIAKS